MLLVHHRVSHFRFEFCALQKKKLILSAFHISIAYCRLRNHINFVTENSVEFLCYWNVRTETEARSRSS